MDTNYYDVLQVSPRADPSVIDAAYRGLLAKYQPLAATDPEALRQVQNINDAYRVLSDPVRRAQYDASLQGTVPLQTPSPTPSPTPVLAPTPTRGPRPGPEPVPLAPPAAPRGLPVWLLALLGVCALGLIGLVCIGGLLAANVGGAGALLFGRPKTVVVVVPTETPTPATALQPTEAQATVPPTAPATAPAANASSFVTAVVMTTQTQGSNFDPVGTTTTFAPGDTFHAVVTIANAPANSAVRAVWFADDVGSAAPPNTKIDEYSLTTQGSRNLDFTLKPKTTWVAGAYHVDVYANGSLARSAKFSVQGGSGTNPNGGGSVIQSTTFARTVADQTFDPVDATDTFTPDDKVLHLVVAIKDAPDNTNFKASWYFGTQLIDSTSLQAGGTRNLNFTLTQNKPWPSGDYHVDIYVNGALDRSPTFTVH